jgi:hypothetical protein
MTVLAVARNVLALIRRIARAAPRVSARQRSRAALDALEQVLVMLDEPEIVDD